MATKKSMELLDEYTNEMKCKTCWSTHFASIKPRSGGRFYRGCWQCSNQDCPTNLAKHYKAALAR